MSAAYRGRICEPAAAARSPVSPRLVLLVFVLAVAPPACVLPHELDWEIGWSEPGLQARAAVVEASISKGGCEGEEVVWRQETAVTRGSWDEPPTLAEGRYGFAARVRDAGCVWFAQGCRDVDLPGDSESTLLVVIEPAVTEPECAAEACIAGACACTEGGDCGTACLSGDCECFTGGCAMRCTAGRECSCFGGDCHVQCPADATCECFGGDCIMDCAPGSSCECAGGGCAMACAEGAQCSCVAGGCG